MKGQFWQFNRPEDAVTVLIPNFTVDFGIIQKRDSLYEETQEDNDAIDYLFAEYSFIYFDEKRMDLSKFNVVKH